MDNIKELEGLIKDLVTDVGSMKEKSEKMEEQLAAYKEMEKNGWQMPKNKDQTDPDFWKPYDLAIQGKSLMRKMENGYQLKDDSRREEIAKWWILFIKSAVQDNPSAYMEMENFVIKLLRVTPSSLML